MGIILSDGSIIRYFVRKGNWDRWGVLPPPFGGGGGFLFPSGGGAVLLIIDFCTNSARPGGSLFWKRDPPDPPKSIRGREFRLSLPLNPLSQRPKEGACGPPPFGNLPGFFSSHWDGPSPLLCHGAGAREVKQRLGHVHAPRSQRAGQEKYQATAG